MQSVDNKSMKAQIHIGYFSVSTKKSQNTQNQQYISLSFAALSLGTTNIPG